MGGLEDSMNNEQTERPQNDLFLHIRTLHDASASIRETLPTQK